MQQGEEVSTEISMDLLREIYPQLGEDGCAGFGALEEFRSLTPQDSGWLIWLLHTRPGRWLVRKLATDPEAQSYSAPAATLALQIIHALVATLFLLVPPAILFLQDLNKSRAFGIMIGSTIIFCGIVSLIQRAQTRLFNTFCAGCGYVAILAAFAVARYLGVGSELDLGLVLRRL
ncbi:hypothetical protein QBC42DRAFT_281140 [Cladorrhinum samala]|uniref:DUF6594 domain-containing protein n=1 Tax=Cladorrhinum samala TaxID=585594 RepID=A0AAV9H7M1_9PEZI|nr:hypothetical protein QBC42DRAFT_281140 [Cladorrhinum samala]